ncbi:MAG TPA: XdhC family protein [Candidatus Paceibacterota bacterium]|nr:XdhC family protein [Verrucomicrobiota bacterium]HRZ45473.1 XdhC family protein [Candidatus Paceibacterota bacterium]HRZ93850.1 XdhC family protein [Candidatus Paceibacterota bacterium]
MNRTENRRGPAGIYQRMIEILESGLPAAQLVVLRTEGSAPCPAGTRAIGIPDGRIEGSIGGGLVEVEALRRVPESVRSDRAMVFDFAMEGRDAEGEQPVCGGRMRVLVDPLAHRHEAAWREAADACRSRGRGVLLTAVRAEEKVLTHVRYVDAADLPAESGFPGCAAMAGALEAETALWIEEKPGGSPTAEASGVLVEPLAPPPQLLVVGGGHVGQAVAWQADRVGFEVTVLDDRPAFAQPTRFPDRIAVRCGGIAEGMNRYPMDDCTYVVIVTRGHRHDAEALASCLGRPSAYVGMISSRRKAAWMREEFIRSGRATAEQLDCVHAPIGLDIGAVTAPEIAASIVAELIAVRRGRLPRRPQPGRVPPER